MATNRSRRLRKKLCVDEFQELGFELNFHYKEGVDADAVNAFMLRFIDQAIEANERPMAAATNSVSSAWRAVARSMKSSGP